MAKQLHFNKNMEALKKLQAGVDKLSSVVGVTLGPKARFPSHHRLACQQWRQPLHATILGFSSRGLLRLACQRCVSQQLIPS